MAAGFEATLLRSAISNAELVNRLGDRAIAVLEDAARAVATQLLTAQGPATVMALQAQLASIRDTFRAAGIKTYGQFVDDLAYQLSTFEGRSEAVIRSMVGDAVEVGSQALASGTAGPAAGVALGGIGAGTTPAVVLQTVATMGPLELTMLASQQEYSLSREFARAFLTPTNGVMRQEVEAQAARLSDLFEKRVRSAVVTGQTNQEVVKQLMGEGKEITGDAAISIRNARTLVRTGVQQVANATNYATIMGNEAVEKVEFVATLDGRTSATCRAMSGRIFDKGKAPNPPLHWSCRSVLAPWQSGGDHGHRSMTMGVVQEDGSVQYLPAYGNREGFTAAQMRLIKQNNQGYAVDYRDWLSAQPKAVQVDILGEKRQAIFQKTGSLVLSSAPSEQKAIMAAGYKDGRQMPRRVRPPRNS
jgi:SPP1 gp7 family putative phage head morphogenesis protein